MTGALLAALLAGFSAAEPVPIYLDPQLVMPVDIWATVGAEVDIYLAHLALDEDGTIDYAWTASGPAGTLSADHWAWTPGAAGDSMLTLSLTGGGRAASASTTIHTGDGALAATKLVLVGDSLTDNSLWPCAVAAALTGETLLGTQVDGGCRNEGATGKTWQWFYSDADSPMTAADGSIDIASYLATLGDTPDVVVWHLGINDFFGPVWVAGEAYWTSFVNGKIEAYIVPMLAAWRAAAPSTIHGLMLITDGSADVASWEANYDPPSDDPWLFARKKQIANKLLIRRFSTASPQGIYVVPSHLAIDKVSGYPAGNALHPRAAGYAQLTAEVVAWLKAVR
jgi:lysophospholipase L1-like esterase